MARAEPWRHPLLAVVLLAALGGGLRGCVAHGVGPVRLLGDEWYYVDVATNLANQRGHRVGDTVALRPPAHAWMLSHRLNPGNPRAPRSIEAMVELQVLLGAVLVALTAWLGQALFDARVGLLAGLVAALYPAFVFQSHYLWSESLFSVLVTAGLLGLVVARRSRRSSLAALSGLAFGVATLTRELAVVAAGLGAVWWITATPPAQRRQAAARAGLMLACTLLVVLPWTLRNQQLLGRFVPVSTVGWFTLAEGNTLPAPDWLAPRGGRQGEFKRQYLAIRGELRRSDFARDWALARIRDEQPTWLPKKLVRTAALLYGPDSVVFEKLREGRYPELPRLAVRLTMVAVLLSYGLVLLGGVLGVAAAPDRSRRWLPGLLFAGITAVHVLANATARFRLPWMPLLMVYASYAALHARELRTRLHGGRGRAALLVLAVWAGLTIPYFVAYQDPLALWNAGR